MKCCSCPSDADDFLNIDDLEAHIAAEHFDCVPFECEKCRFSKFPTEFAIKRHFEEDHRMSEYYIRYKVSRQINEKLRNVRECLEQSCVASGVDFPFTNRNFPVLNNTVFGRDTSTRSETTTQFQPATSQAYGGSNGVTTRILHTPNSRPASRAVDESSATAAATTGRASSDGGTPGEDVFGRNAAEMARRNLVVIKSEDNRFGNASPSGSTDGDGATGQTNADGPSAALAAFIRNASQAVTSAGNGSFENAGDSNNNEKSPANAAVDFSNFYSKLLTPTNSLAPNVANDPELASEMGENKNDTFVDALDDQQNQAQQLLRRLESHLSSQDSPPGLLRRRRQRQVVKRFGIPARQPKRRFGLLQNAIANNVSPSSNEMQNANFGALNGGENNFAAQENGAFFQHHQNASTAVNGAGAPYSTALGRASATKVNEVQCQECKEMVTNRATSLNYHVNMKHLKYSLFVCKGCGRKFLWQRTTIVTHVQRYHNGDESLIEDNSSLYMSKINSRRKAFFPVKCSQVNTPITNNFDGPTFGGVDVSTNGGGGVGDCSANNSLNVSHSGHLHHQSGLMPAGPSTSSSMYALMSSLGNGGGGGGGLCDNNGGAINNIDGNNCHNASASSMMTATSAAANGGHGCGGIGQQHHFSNSNLNTTGNYNYNKNGTKAGGNNNEAGEMEDVDEDLMDANGDDMRSTGATATVAMNGAGGSVQRRSTGARLRCRLCDEMVVSSKPWILLNHANSEHLHFPLYECGACKQVFSKYLRSYTVKHMRHYHEGRDDFIIDNRPMYQERLEAKCLELFGVSI